MKKINKQEFIHLYKFLIVGVINTALTYVSYTVLRLFDISPLICNAIGYVVGLINSFLWNKKWVFKSHKRSLKYELISFFLIFILCYVIQLYSFKFMIDSLNINEYIAQILSMGLYTIINFILNRLISFRQ